MATDSWSPPKGEDAGPATRHARSTYDWEPATRHKTCALTNLRDHFRRPGRPRTAGRIRRLRSQRGRRHNNTSCRAPGSGRPPRSHAADRQPRPRTGRRERSGIAAPRVTGPRGAKTWPEHRHIPEGLTMTHLGELAEGLEVDRELSPWT